MRCGLWRGTTIDALHDTMEVSDAVWLTAGTIAANLDGLGQGFSFIFADWTAIIAGAVLTGADLIF